VLGAQFDEVLAAAQAGAAWALTRLYDDLARPVTAFVRLRGAEDPEGVASDTFIGVFESLGRFTGDESGFRAWVFTIARRRVLDDQRRRRRRPQHTDGEVPEMSGGNVEEDALAAMSYGRVAAMLAHVTDPQREVLLLRFVADLSLEQVAAATDRSVGSVKQLQQRALSRLQKKLQQEAVTS
jgi:RNA polymerase sigma factor (sigma-70 family)